MKKLLAVVVVLLLMAAFAAPSVRAREVARPSGSIALRLKAGPVDLTRPGIGAGAPLLAAGKPGLYVVQFEGPITADHWKALTVTGAEVDSYLPDYAFLTRMTPAQAEALSGWEGVRAVSRYLPAWKMAAGKDEKETGLVRVMTFRGEETAVAAMLQGLGARVEDRSDRTVVAAAGRNLLAQIAKSEHVTFIDQVRPFMLHNDVAAGLIQVSTVGGPWSQGLTGEGQVVGIADTGLDTGDLTTLHPELKNRLHVTPVALGRAGDWSDPDGHGTHTAGSILGDGSVSGSIKGMAPGAKLVFQSVMDAGGGLGGLPADLNNLFADAGHLGAMLHTNSWGVPLVYGGWVYDSAAEQVDQYAWAHKDFTILFSAGNDGSDPYGNPRYYSVTTPGTAKNAITVGASENNRPQKGTYADNPGTVATFSSRGTAPDGRTKPDLVAPGTWILSTRSTIAPDSGYWGTYDSLHAFNSGTSMSTPITAGAAALVRQFYTTAGVAPMASLIKATLINGAQDLGYGWNSKDQGWGRIDLTASLYPPNGLTAWYHNESTSLTTGATSTYSFVVQSGQPLKVTLVWTDYPGAVQASKELVNDLDLEVTAPGGEVYKGNCFVNNTAATTCSTFDRTNNVENVYVNAPVAGVYQVKVNGFNIPYGPQPYALVLSGANLSEAPADTTPPTVAMTQPASGDTVSGIVTVSAEASDEIAVAAVDFFLENGLQATDTTAPYTWTWDTVTAGNGAHTLTAKARDTAGNTSAASVTVTVDNGSVAPVAAITLTGSLSAGGAKYFYIDVTSPGTVSLNLAWSVSANYDLYLYNPAGQQVATARTTANPETSTYEAATTGRYKIRVSSASGSGNFTLQASHPINPAVTAVLDQSGSLAQSATQTYNIPVGAAGSINVSVSFPAGTDFDLTLLSPSGSTLASAMSTSLNPEAISYAVSTPGTYQVRVKAFRGSGAFDLHGYYPK